MAGYSGKPLAQKLGIVAGSTVATIGAPANYQDLLGGVPDGVRFCQVNAQPQLIHYFCTERARLAKDLPVLRKRIRDDAMLWVSWPKKSAGLATTVTEDVVREVRSAARAGGHEGLRGGRDLVCSSPGGPTGEPEVDSATASCCITATVLERSRSDGLPERKLSQAPGRLSFPGDRATGEGVLRCQSRGCKTIDSLWNWRRDRAAAAGRGHRDEGGGG